MNLLTNSGFLDILTSEKLKTKLVAESLELSDFVHGSKSVTFPFVSFFFLLIKFIFLWYTYFWKLS